MQNPDLGSKIKIAKKMSKLILQIIWSFSVEKTAAKNTNYSRNETILKIGHYAKALAHSKFLTWGEKLKLQKKCQNQFYKLKLKLKKPVQIYSTNHLQLFCAQNCSKKH